MYYHELGLQSYMKYRHDCNGEIVFVSDEIRTKIPQKPNYESQKI